MIYIYLSIAILIPVVIGTAAANLLILWIIGARVKQAEKKQIEAMMEARREYIEKFNAEMKRQQDYIKMES